MQEFEKVSTPPLRHREYERSYATFSSIKPLYLPNPQVNSVFIKPEMSTRTNEMVNSIIMGHPHHQPANKISLNSKINKIRIAKYSEQPKQ